MNKHLFTILLSVILFININCKKNPVAPPTPTNCTYPPGNRNYSWQMDTIAWFPSTVGGVWAFSDSDAYVMGNIFRWENGIQKGYIGLHWDGKIWGTDINGTVEEIKHVSNDVIGDDHFLVSIGNWSINPSKPALGEFNNKTKKWKGFQYEIEGELRSVWTDGKGFFIAVGDNGMVYTKDGYSSDWIYTKAPTEFNFYNVTGISKEEVYMTAYQSLATGGFYVQGWKLYQNSWFKLFDTKESGNTPLDLISSDYPNQMGVWRCNITDSLKLYVIGDQSYLFESKGQNLNFKKNNLSELGLPLKNNGRSGIDINIFSPSDLWIIGTRYSFYHWNGTSFYRMIIPSLPNDDIQYGTQRRLIKTSTGKIFFPTEVSSQVYVILQWVPK